MALELFPSSKAKWKNKISNSDPERSFNDIWPKIMIRRAESFEHLESFKKALETYQELINKNFLMIKSCREKEDAKTLLILPLLKNPCPLRRRQRQPRLQQKNRT